MTWRVRFRPSAARDLEALPRDVARRVLNYLEGCRNNPRRRGLALKVGRRVPLLWRYRIGAYRVICHLDDATDTMLVLRVAHRREAHR